MAISIAWITAFAAIANALAVSSWEPHHRREQAQTNLWNLKQLTSFVVFGDSYSDDSRLAYFIENNGTAPPVGWVNPVVRAPRFSTKSHWSHTDHQTEQRFRRWRPHMGRVRGPIHRRQSVQLRRLRSCLQQRHHPSIPQSNRCAFSQREGIRSPGLHCG